MMDLDSAIQHCKEQVQEQAKKGCYSCAEDHQQLAEWLKELKEYREQSGDAISRQAVLNAMYELCNTGETLKENPWRDNPHIDAVVEAIEELPSVTPQPKTGRWKYVRYEGFCGNWHCSECRTIIPHMPEEKDNTPIYKWCPMCGAKMEVENG